MPNLRPLSRVLALARPELPTLAAASLVLLFTAGLNLMYPQLIRLIVDDVQGGGGAQAVHTWSGLLVVLFALGAGATALRAWLFTLAGERIVLRLRQRLFGIRFDTGGTCEQMFAGRLAERYDIRDLWLAIR